jgi:hypothetical protein
VEIVIMIVNSFRRWLRQFKSLEHKATTKRKLKHSFKPQCEQLEGRAVPALLTPFTLRGAYGIDHIQFAASGVVGNGAGQTIAVVDIGADDTSLVSDLQYFDQQLFGSAGAQLLDTFGSYDVPNPGSTKPWFAAMTDLNFPPGTYTPTQIARHDLETAEDVEWAHAVAPMANILLVETGSIQSGTNYAGILQAANPTWGISVIASSSSHFPTFHPEDYQDNSVTYVGITGDTGTSTLSQLDGFHLYDYPASTSQVLAVGGTTLTLNPDGSYNSETGWGFANPNRFLTSTTATYSPAASWTSTPGGFSGTQFVTPANSPSSTTATWTTQITFSDTLGINDKGLELSATWTPSASNAANAQYEIYDNGNLINTVSIDQQVAPIGTTGTLNSRTATFQELSAITGVQVGDTITVVLEAQGADGQVVADAIGIAPDDATGGGLGDAPPGSFQNGLVIHNGNSILDNTFGNRAYPDVAFDGDYVNSPVLIWNQRQAQLVAGTSLGSPAWAGLIAIADQGLATVGQAPLNTDQVLTGLYKLPSWDFHDPTTGYNGFLAGPGYDLLTGLGTPIANQLVLDLDNTVTPTPGPLTYEAPEGQGPNNIQVIQSGTNIEVLNHGIVVASEPWAETTKIEIIGAQNTQNTLTLDVPFTPLSIPPLSFDGGSPGGTLIIEGGPVTSEVDLATDAHSGTLYANNQAPISYTNLGTLIDTATATNFKVFDTLAHDQVTIQNDPNSPENGVPTSQISGNGFATVDFGNKSNVIFVDSTRNGHDTITIDAPLVNNATFVIQQIPSITNGPATATATVGIPYSFTYTTLGNPVPTFSLLPGSTLPPGLSLSANGVISGTPTGTGTFTGTVDAYNGVAIDATQNYSITVNKTRPRIAAKAGPSVVIGSGKPMSAEAQLSGGFEETGLLTFRLYAPSGVLVDTEAVAVHGIGIYITPHGYLPRAAGTYQWVATYGGDLNNNAVSTIKGQTPEVATGLLGPLAATLQPTVSTASVTNTVATSPAGSPGTTRVLLGSSAGAKLVLAGDDDDSVRTSSSNERVSTDDDGKDLPQVGDRDNDFESKLRR